MNAVKLEDIANMLGISVSTVSRAISGNGRVGEKTRERVLKAVRESDYTVNAVARSLRLKDAKNIGIVVPDITNTFFSALIKGAQQVCRENSYSLMVCNSDENPEYEEEALQLLLEKQISGLILASVGRTADTLRQYERLSIPVVYIDNLPDASEARDMVSIDNFSAARRLTLAMIERGHRHVGMITGPLSQSTARLRYEGFCRALEVSGIEMRNEWVLEGDFHMESGYSKMKQLLKLPEVPDAMIFANNHLAYGALNAIREAGLDVPGDIAIAAFDAIDHTKLITPLITCINQPVQEIGKQAAAAIFSRLSSDEELPPRELILDSFLLEGNSW